MNSFTYILISIALFLFPYLGKIWFNKNTLSSAVVSLGLFSTFCGIIWCLFTLNAENIDTVLPQLLADIKITFYSSITGLASSIIIKIFPTFYGIKKTSSSATQEDQLLELLSSIDKKMGDIHPLPSGSESSHPVFQELSEKILELQKQQIAQIEQFNHTNQKLSESIQTIGPIIEKLNSNEITRTDHEIINKQQSTLETEIIHLNASCQNLDVMINNTKDLLQQQMNDVEEKFATKLDSMQEFSQTLLAIVKKLSQDHNTIQKQQNLNQEPEQ